MENSNLYNIVPKVKVNNLLSQKTIYLPQNIKYGINNSIPAQGYVLHIKPEEILIDSKDEAGKYYAKKTLEQLVTNDNSGEQKLPLGIIEDWPSIKTRGVMLDISRCKVPKLKTLFSIIDILSNLKYNHLQLYTEHTFAYSNHKTVWEDSSPLSHEDISQIQNYCKDHFIELSANQNTLGHMERWLIHDQYKHLGLKIGNVLSPYGLMHPATTLNPTNPEAKMLVLDLLEELVPLFSSDKVNIGLDEPFELEPNNYLEWGNYLNYLAKSEPLKNKKILIWSDMLNIYPKLIEQVPENAVVLEWGYEYNSPFAANLERLSKANLEHWVAPGTSSWLSITGRLTNCIENTKLAVTNAINYESTGFLMTDWGDFGHLQWWPFSWPGIVAGGELSWCGVQLLASYNLDVLKQSISQVVYPKTAKSLQLSDILLSVSDVNSKIKCQFPNLSTLALSLYLPQLHTGSGLTTNLELSDIDNCLEILEDNRVKLNQVEISADLEQLRCGIELMELILRDNKYRLNSTGHIKDVPTKLRKSLSEELAELITKHRQFWSQSYQIGGITESLEWLKNLHKTYETGFADPNWSGPLKILHNS
jgi:hypothetical protein